MAACSCRVAVLAVLFFTLAVMLLASAPCAAGAAPSTVLPVTDQPRAGGEVPPYYAEGAGNKGDDSTAAATLTETTTGLRGRGSLEFGGRRMAARWNAASRVLGSVPSPGQGN